MKFKNNNLLYILNKGYNMYIIKITSNIILMIKYVKWEYNKTDISNMNSLKILLIIILKITQVN